METGSTLRLHSADHVLEQEIHLLTMHSPSGILPETSRTVKAPRYRTARFASVALMDARSIAANPQQTRGYLTAATDVDVNFSKPKYFFDKTIYENRVFDSHGVADPSGRNPDGTKH